MRAAYSPTFTVPTSSAVPSRMSSVWRRPADGVHAGDCSVRCLFSCFPQLCEKVRQKPPANFTAVQKIYGHVKLFFSTASKLADFSCAFRKHLWQCSLINAPPETSSVELETRFLKFNYNIAIYSLKSIQNTWKIMFY